jgi:tetratricopeptide (TPR) repeat protein
LKSFPKTRSQKSGVRSQKLLWVGAVICGVAALRGELTQWAENVTAWSKLEAVFFRTVSLPSGPVPVRRPPKETRPELSKLITATPTDAELYSLRALEAEQQLDFAAAEADWKKDIEVSKDRGAARVALADFYHRRLKPVDEFAALSLAAMEFPPDSDKLLPDSRQRTWKLYERMMQLIDEQRLDSTLGATQYWNWITVYPKDSQLYPAFFKYAIDHQRYDVAQQVIEAYQRAFPKDDEFPIEARAELTSKIAPAAQALAVYERSFRPLWSAHLIEQYFALLKQTNSLRVYLDRAQAGIAANPADLTSAARLFYYWQQQKNLPAAERALTEFRQRKDARQSPWTAEELLTLARLYEAAHDYDEAARNYYALYSAARSDDAVGENALGSLARMIFNAPEQSIRFGSGNLSLYRDVAMMDPHPGFLNGILSLLLNYSDPPERAAVEEQSAAPYFRRARAAELVALFESRFPNSSQRTDLRERVIEAYAIYGSNDGVVRAGTKFLTDFANAPNRTSVAMRVADAYARTGQTQREFAIYDSLLSELAGRAQNVPLGAMLQVTAQTSPQAAAQPPTAATNPFARVLPGEAAASSDAKVETKYDSVRSPEYARVLDRYVARLVSLRRVRDALAIYRREIDRNPNDPGLYDALAAFLEQNRLGAEIEQTYQRAITQFPDHTWEHKLARWYLRQRRQADVARITRDVVQIFSGTELDSYFKEIVHPAQPVGPAMYLELNRFAQQRFPHHLSFVRNLLTAYSNTATRDDAAYLTLLREHWSDADDLRMRFFERLSRTGRLGAELSAVRASNTASNTGRWAQAEDQNPAAVRILAEGEAWRGHFESAAPMFLAIENDYPADAIVDRRTMAIYRSLGTIDPKLTDTAIAAGEKLSAANPRDTRTLTRLGEIEADRERFDKAAGYWDRIPEIDPAKADSYLESATIFWDYYRYDDALRAITQARQRLTAPDIFAYEAGAIFENQRAYDRAAREYARGAIAQPGSNAERRLIALARRPDLRADIEQLTINLASARNPEMGAVKLRIALLRNQSRRGDLESFLLELAGRTTSPELLAAIEDNGRVDGFPRVEDSAIQRLIAIATDPVEKMRLRLSLARFYEGQGQVAQGAQVVDALYRDNPTILGVVRAAVDYHARNRNAKRAVDILEESAGRADAGYRSQFLLEAARKSVQAGEYARGRGFAEKLLAADPYRAEFVAVMADAYARSGDDRGLRAFYDAKIRDLHTATISQPQRVVQIAAMRRALIPVLTRAMDYSAAVDEYIEILNRYPEDEPLAREAAAYASANGVAQKLRSYYEKAAADSPSDFRWPMALGRIDAQLEDFPSAIAAYTRAAGVRPDRADLLIARLNLEERLLRFDEAGATAQKLYDLSYRNPQWMEKLAEVRARQGRIADAMEALKKAWIEGRSDNPRQYFAISQKLESWGALAEARRFAEDGMKRVTADNRDTLLPEIQKYGGLLTRLRAYESATPEVVATGAAQMAAAVGAYYSPEEKAKFGEWALAHPRVELVERAGMADLEAKIRFQNLLSRPTGPNARANQDALVELQKQRLAFDELGSQLEAYDRSLTTAASAGATPAGNARGRDLNGAAEAYRSSGNTAAERRVLEAQNVRKPLDGGMLERYLRLTLAQPQTFGATMARANNTVADAMVNYALQHSAENATLQTVAFQAIAARGPKMGPLWSNAYTALAGLYFDVNTAPVRAAYPAILGDMTIGSRVASGSSTGGASSTGAGASVGKPVDRSQQLAGAVWFYYGGRYGEYLGMTKQAGAEDYLPAMIEGSPAQSQPYFDLAEYFREAGSLDAADADYRHAIELNSSRADAHDRLALIAQGQGRREDAIQEWRLAIAALTATMNRAGVPQKFWTDSGDVMRHIGAAKMGDLKLGPLRDDLDKMLRLYVHRNGTYQVEPLLEGAMAASADTASGLTWIVDLSHSAPDPAALLNSVLNLPWIPESQKDALHRSIVESAQAKLTASFGDERNYAHDEVWRAQFAWADYLLGRRETSRAAEVLAAVPQEARTNYSSEIIALEMRVAARTGKLAAQLGRYGDSVSIDVLRNAAMQLEKDGDAASGRRVLEFIYNRELKAGHFAASNFLGLAGIRLEEKDVTGAVALLRRATLVSEGISGGSSVGAAGDAFSTLQPSADLLEKTGHPSEAAAFLADLTKAEPWNWAARERLAALQGAGPGASQSAGDVLAQVAKSPEAPYASRVAAALALRKMKAAPLAGTDGELVLLSSQAALGESEVSKPYFVAARLEAAGLGSANPAHDSATRIQLLSAAIAIDPRKDVKMALFRTAIEARRDTLAIAVAHGIVPYMTYDRELPQWQIDNLFSDLPQAERVTMVRGLGEVEQRLGDLRGALMFYQTAQRIEPADGIQRALDGVRAQVEAAAKNQARRPIVSANLEQDRLVHPMVVAR